MLPSFAGPAKTGSLSAEVVTGVAIRKGESDPPILPDSEYPAWLFELMKPEPSVAELERMYKAEGLELHQVRAGGSLLTQQQQQ
jgi:large subunit ribosomal protein L54